jgi:hypothetical protein
MSRFVVVPVLQHRLQTLQANSWMLFNVFHCSILAEEEEMLLIGALVTR